MVLKTDHERVKTLLRDTITLLCKNGLAFKSQFSLEALIGVTLDEGDVFLVSINEIVKSDNYQEPKTPLNESDNLDLDSELSGSETREDGPHRRRRKRRKVKTENTEMGENDEQSTDAPLHDENSRVPSDGLCKQQDNVEEDSDDDRKDVVIIKDEIDTWSESYHQEESGFTDMNSQGGSGSTDNIQLSSATLVPVSGQDSGNAWIQPYTHHARNMLNYSMPSSLMPGIQPLETTPDTDTRTVMAFTCHLCGQGYMKKPAFLVHMNRHEGKYLYYCDICSKGYNSTGNLTGHMATHTGKKEFVCTHCDKAFAYKNHLKRHVTKDHNQLYSADCPSFGDCK